MSQKISVYSSENEKDKKKEEEEEEEEEEEDDDEEEKEKEEEKKEEKENEKIEKKEQSEKSEKISSNNDSQSQYSSEVYKNHNNTIQFSQIKEEINKTKEKRPKLMVMVIPKTNKDLPLPLNTLYFFLELFAYEYGLKQLTDEDNKLVFYLMNINWLNELKLYYNYKCIEFIVKKELKENKNFLNKLNNLLNITNLSKLYDDYKLINKFNNIIINPKKIKIIFVDKEELFAPKKIEYDIININKNIKSPNLEYLEYFTYYPQCILINERMRNILYLEYKYLKFSQFQKGDITLVDDKIYIKLTNKIIEVCSFEKQNLIITPLYILYYFDISNVPFWENVLYKKDFKKDYLLKRIYKDNKHIQCMLDPFNKEYIGYSINLSIPYTGEPIKEYNFINENISNNELIPSEEELLNEVNEITKFSMDGYYNNKFEENQKQNLKDDSENQYMLRMKLMRKKKQEEINNKKKKYIETLNKFKSTQKSEESGFVNVNGEIIGFVQGDDLTKNGEGFLGSTGSEFLSSDGKDDNNKNKENNKNNKLKNNEINKIKEVIEEESDDYNGEIIVERYKKQMKENNSKYSEDTDDNNNNKQNKEGNEKDCFIF